MSLHARAFLRRRAIFPYRVDPWLAIGSDPDLRLPLARVKAHSAVSETTGLPPEPRGGTPSSVGRLSTYTCSSWLEDFRKLPFLVNGGLPVHNVLADLCA